MVVGRVLEMLGSRGVSVKTVRPACLGTESPIYTLCPLEAELFFLTSLFIERFDRWSLSDMGIFRQLMHKPTLVTPRGF